LCSLSTANFLNDGEEVICFKRYFESVLRFSGTLFLKSTKKVTATDFRCCRQTALFILNLMAKIDATVVQKLIYHASSQDSRFFVLTHRFLVTDVLLWVLDLILVRCGVRGVMVSMCSGVVALVY
jgi:hypothetical protein